MQRLIYWGVPRGSTLQIATLGFPRLVTPEATARRTPDTDRFPLERRWGTEQRRFGPEVASASFRIRLPDGDTIDCGSYRGGDPPPQCLSSGDGLVQRIGYRGLPEGSMLDVSGVGSARLVGPTATSGGGGFGDRTPLSGHGLAKREFDGAIAEASFRIMLPDGTTMPCGNYRVGATPQCLAEPTAQADRFGLDVGTLHAPANSVLQLLVDGDPVDISEIPIPDGGFATLDTPAEAKVAVRMRLPDGAIISC